MSKMGAIEMWRTLLSVEIQDNKELRAINEGHEASMHHLNDKIGHLLDEVGRLNMELQDHYNGKKQDEWKAMYDEERQVSGERLGEICRLQNELVEVRDERNLALKLAADASMRTRQTLHHELSEDCEDCQEYDDTHAQPFDCPVCNQFENCPCPFCQDITVDPVVGDEESE